MQDITQLIASKQKVVQALLFLKRKYGLTNAELLHALKVRGVGINIKNNQINIYVRSTDKKTIEFIKEKLGGHTVDGHEINFIYTENIKALNCSLNPQVYTRPICGGDSIGNNAVGAGTFGVCVYGIDGNKYGITNSHVAANASTIQHPNANIGDIIYAPGCLDDYGCNHPIGTLHKFIPLDETNHNLVDCALFKPYNQNDISNEITSIGILTGYIPAQEGMSVKKFGRTTKLLSGTITDINATIDVDYGNYILTFDNCIITTNMSLPGDSGSCTVGPDNKATGLLFAGSETLTVHNRIENVLSALEVSITPNGEIPPPIQGTPYQPGDINYQLVTLTAATLSTGLLVGVLPIIEQQFQLWFSRKI